MNLAQLAGLFLIVLGAIMVVLVWLRAFLRGGGPIAGAPVGADDPTIHLIDKLFELIDQTIGDPNRWGFTLIALGIVLYIAGGVVGGKGTAS